MEEEYQDDLERVCGDRGRMGEKSVKEKEFQVEGRIGEKTREEETDTELKLGGIEERVE